MLKKLANLGNGLFRWKIRLRLPGKQINRHIDATPEAAREIYAELGNQKSRHKSGLSFSYNFGADTLKEKAAAYAQHLYTLDKNVRHIEDVTRHLNLLCSVVGDGARIQQINRDHIIEWQRQRKEQPYRKKLPTARTVNKAKDELSAFFTWCGGENPARKVGKIKELEPPLKALPWCDFEKFADAAWLRPHFGVFVELLGESAARVSELTCARVGDVDTERRVWEKIIKPGRRVVMDAGPWVLFAAKDRKKEDWLCPRENGKAWSYSMIDKSFTRFSEAAGIGEITPHYLRHGRACWDLIEGRSVWDVQMKLAHTSIATTERYVRAAQQMKRAEAAGVVHSRNPEDTIKRLHSEGPESLSRLYPNNAATGGISWQFTAISGSEVRAIQPQKLKGVKLK